LAQKYQGSDVLYNRLLSLYDDFILCSLEGFNSLQNCVTLRQTICMQPYTEGILPIQVSQKYRDMSVLIEPLINECALPVKVAGTICNTRGRCESAERNGRNGYYSTLH